MARARNIKPSFFQNEELGELDPVARLFFIGLWTVADYRGCVEFRPKRLKVQLLPYDECNTETLANNLERSGFIRFYSVCGQRYLKIVNFEKHQNPHKNERESGSEIPDIDQDDSQAVDSIEIEKNPDKNGTTPDKDGTAPADSLLLIPDSPIPLPEGSAPPATPATLPKKSEPVETDLQAACREVWKAYGSAYFDRYGTEPVRNATVSSQVKTFVQRIGRTEAPLVAAFYVSHPGQFYVKNMHQFGHALKDAEKLRTEWATRRVVTDTQARHSDRMGANMSAADEAMRILEGEVIQ